MKCIRCGDTMEKLTVRGTLLDRCAPCDAIWLDGGELESLQQEAEGKGRGRGETEADADTLAAQRRAETEAEAARVVEVLDLCPRCQRGLEITFIGGVEVERCRNCGGAFFDQGELQTVLRQTRPGLLDRLLGRVGRLRA